MRRSASWPTSCAYRGEAVDVTLGGEEVQRWIEAYFGSESSEPPAYRDIAGLCKAATLEAIEAQGWSLNPGRYVGVAAGEDLSDEDFKEQLEKLQEELEGLNGQARELEARIAANVAEILGGGRVKGRQRTPQLRLGC